MSTFSTPAKGEQFLNCFVPKASFVQRVQDLGRERTVEELARMSKKTPEEVRATLLLLRNYTIGSPGTCSVMGTCQMLGMGQVPFMGTIGGDFEDTPKMSFQKEFTNVGRGYIVARTSSGFVLTARGASFLEGLAGLTTRNGSVILPIPIWQNLIRRITVPDDFEFFPTPQEQAVRVMNLEDLRSRFNETRIRRGLREGAPLLTRVALNFELALTMSRFSRGEEMDERLIRELNEVDNTAAIMNRVKMVEVFDKLTEDITAELSEGEVMSLGKILNLGERDEFYGFDIEFLRQHAQAEAAMAKVRNLPRPGARSGLSLSDRLRLARGETLAPARASGHGGQPEADPSAEPTPGSEEVPPPPRPALRNTSARVRFLTAGGRAAQLAPTPGILRRATLGGAPPQRVRRPVRQENAPANADPNAAPVMEAVPEVNEAEEPAAPAARPAPPAPATNVPPAPTAPTPVRVPEVRDDPEEEKTEEEEDDVHPNQENYNNAGEHLPPHDEGLPDTHCSVTLIPLFGTIAVSAQGNRYNRRGVVDEDGVLVARDPLTNQATTWTWETAPLTNESATTELQEAGVLADDNVDTSNLLRRPTPQEIDLLAFLEGLEPIFFARSLNYPEIEVEYETHQQEQNQAAAEN